VSVKVAPATEVVAPGALALKTPSVILEDCPGSNPTLISLDLELKVIVVPPIVMLLPLELTVPPEVPAPKVPVVPAVKVTGAAEADAKPTERNVITPSSQRVGRLRIRIIIVTPDIQWTRETSSSLPEVRRDRIKAIFPYWLLKTAKDQCQLNFIAAEQTKLLSTFRPA
jgi:hypothetical protein